MKVIRWSESPHQPLGQCFSQPLMPPFIKLLDRACGHCVQHTRWGSRQAPLPFQSDLDACGPTSQEGCNEGQADSCRIHRFIQALPGQAAKHIDNGPTVRKIQEVKFFHPRPTHPHHVTKLAI